MDAARYARVRDLFLAADELAPEQREAYLRDQTGDDNELFEDVLSLLAEHDPEFAQLEGEQALPVPAPSNTPTLRGSLSGHGSAAKARSDSTKRGDTGRQRNPEDLERQKKTSQITRQGGAFRTHASPRGSDSTKRKPTPSTLLWAQRTRRSRRRTSGWLWLAALLPTALIGWWTYGRVDSLMEQAVGNELKGAVDFVAMVSEQFLDDKAQLVELWSRQPSMRQSIEELVALAESKPPLEELRSAPQSGRIKAQLQELSGHDEVKFVVWNESYKTLASWLPDSADVGNPVHPSGASNLARVMTGETVLFGPERLVDNTEGFVPETAAPVMAIIVPIRDGSGQIIAAMLVRGTEMFPDFSRMFAEATMAGGLDAYAINRDALMVTDSPHAVSLATQSRLDLPADQIAAQLRVADPGVELTTKNASSVQRNIRPVTIAVASASTGNSEVRTEPYRNYSGEWVVGAWRWINNWNMGVVIERNAHDAFAAVRVVRFSFLLLGSLLALTASFAAAKIARTATAQQAAVHPLSRYEISGELGSGGMGVVLKARHRQLGRDTALKILRGDRHTKEDRLRFDREAQLAASLSNPHSVTIYDYGRSEEGEAFCVMEFLRGLTLQEVVARSGHQPIGRVLFIAQQICEALSEAHAMELLHRDIKPQNVMLSLDQAVGDWAVVFDYGLAKPLKPDDGVYQTSETIWAGTPMYMAPERFREPSVMNPRSDIYSVGCVAYYLLSGRPPFIECDPESLFALIISEHPISMAVHRGKAIPQPINDMVMKCMAKNASDRFQSIDELAKEIDGLRATHPWNVDDARVWWKLHGSG